MFRYRQFLNFAAAGGSPNCTKGKSCKAACIHVNHDCLEGLPPEAAATLNQMSKFLGGKISSGEISEEDAETVVDAVKDDDKAIKEFSKLISSGKATEADLEGVAAFVTSITLVPGQDRNATRTMSYDELDDIMKNGLDHFAKAAEKSIDKNGKFDPTLPGGMGDLVASKFLTKEISDEAAAAAYAMLPTRVKTALNKAGAVDKGLAFAGFDDDGNVVFGNAGKERGLFLVKRWMEQDGKDPYTGRPIDIRNAEPEHLFSFSEAKKAGASGDQPYNLLWSASQPNNLKKDYTFPEFKKIVADAHGMGREAYTEKVYAPAAAKAAQSKGRKAAAPTDLSAAIAGQSKEERAKAISKLAETYGDTGSSPQVRYLYRAAGLSWQYIDKDPGQRVGGRPSWVSKNVPDLPGLGGARTSKAILVALAVTEGEKRGQLIQRANELLKARQLSKAEIERVRQDPSIRLELQAKRNEQYRDALAEMLKQEVPDIQNYL